MAFLLKKHLSPFLFPVPYACCSCWPAFSSSGREEEQAGVGARLTTPAYVCSLLGALPPFPEVGIRYLEAPWSV